VNIPKFEFVSDKVQAKFCRKVGLKVLLPVCKVEVFEVK
jgi:hypothetical protein